jgi:hypothetical protein
MFKTVKLIFNLSNKSYYFDYFSLTETAKERDQLKLKGNSSPTTAPQKSNDIFSVLSNAQGKFQESVNRKNSVFVFYYFLELEA